MRTVTFLLVAAVLVLGSCNKDVETPQCVLDMIEAFESDSVGNVPDKIERCIYKREIVYYISAPCCDQYSVVMDENCNSICSPDGGFTGDGDGECSNFFDKRRKVEVIWEAP